MERTAELGESLSTEQWSSVALTMDICIGQEGLGNHDAPRSRQIPAEEELILRVQNRDKGALGLLYDMYSSALYISVIRIVKSRECAEDVLQEVFVRIWIHARQYEPSRGKLYTWMMNIARNLAIDKVKSKGFREERMNQEIGSVLHQVESECNTTFNSDRLGVRELVGSLKPSLKEIVELVYFQGYTQAEASHRLGIPIGTAKTRLRLALRQIRGAFA